MTTKIQPKIKNENLVSSPRPTQLNDAQKTDDALRTIKEYHEQKGHSIGGYMITPIHWKHIFEALFRYQKSDLCPDKAAFKSELLEFMSAFHYDEHALSEYGQVIFTGPDTHMNIFITIDTREKDTR